VGRRGHFRDRNIAEFRGPANKKLPAAMALEAAVGASMNALLKPGFEAAQLSLQQSNLRPKLESIGCKFERAIASGTKIPQGVRPAMTSGWSHLGS
jgi:hypothetical protein